MQFDPAVEAWRADVETERFQDMPTDALLAWIAEESAGNPCATGIIQDGRNVEAGIGQGYFEHADSELGGWAVADLRAACGTDPHNQHALRELTQDERLAQVSSLVTDAKASLDRSRAQLTHAGLKWSEAEVWCLAKLQHGLPAIAGMLLAPAAQLGRANTWRMWWQWIAGLSQAEVMHIAPPVARFMPLHRFAANAERVGCAVGALP